jgi:plasmid stabilization system protein ParE
MRYTVIWTPEARDSLAEIWLAFEDRDAVASAANALDRALAAKGKSAGEHLLEGLYRTAENPLVVYYSVSDPDARIEVNSVAYIP